MKKPSSQLQTEPGSRKNFAVVAILQNPYRKVEYPDANISVNVTRYELELRSIQIASRTVSRPSTSCCGHVSSRTPVNPRRIRPETRMTKRKTRSRKASPD